MLLRACDSSYLVHAMSYIWTHAFFVARVISGRQICPYPTEICENNVVCGCCLGTTVAVELVLTPLPAGGDYLYNVIDGFGVPK